MGLAAAAYSVDPSVSPVLFSDNDAGDFGGDIFIVKNLEQDNNVFLGEYAFTSSVTSNGKNLIRYATQSIAISPTNSFQKVNKYFSILEPYIVISVYDAFGRLNVSDSSSLVQASILDYNCSGKLPYFSGWSSAYTSGGRAVFDKLSVYCMPLGFLRLLFTFYPSGMSSEFVTTTTADLSFRDCVDGEILVDNGKLVLTLAIVFKHFFKFYS